jgi:hypothetical protein
MSGYLGAQPFDHVGGLAFQRAVYADLDLNWSA